MRRFPLTAALLACTAALGACGGDGGEDDDSEGSAGAPGMAVTRYLDAYRRGDGDVVCASITAAARKGIGSDCPAAIETVTKQTASNKAVTDALKSAKVEGVDVKGDRATVMLSIASGGQRSEIPIALVRAGGKWLLAQPPASPAG